MPIIVVDKSADGKVQVQKVTKPSGELVRYQVGIPGEAMKPYPTLVEARAVIGKATLPTKKRPAKGTVKVRQRDEEEHVAA